LGTSYDNDAENRPARLEFQLKLQEIFLLDIMSISWKGAGEEK